MSDSTTDFVPRTLEPELMDSAEEAALYDAMDHSEVNAGFTMDFVQAWSSATGMDQHSSGTVLDLGSGTARIPILICRDLPAVHVVAVDAAEHMQQVAQRNIDAADLSNRISLSTCDVKTLGAFETATIDSVISNTLLHHIADPSVVLASSLRVLRSGGLLFLRDLMRPNSASEIDRLTALHAAGEPEASRQLLHQSLHAALTLDEIRRLVEPLGVPADAVQPTSDRHWTITFQTP